MLNRLDGFSNATVFIAHGNADDNVHFQNSAVLVQKLQEKGIQFRMMVQLIDNTLFITSCFLVIVMFCSPYDCQHDRSI